MGLLDSILGFNSSSNTQTAVDQGTSDLWKGSTDANRVLNQSTANAGNAYTTGATNASNALSAGYDQARGDLTSYGAQAQGQLAGGRDAAVGTILGGNAAYSPYSSSGGAASGMLSNALGLNGPQGNASATAAFTAAPGYQYTVDQATDATARKAASLGMAASGNTLSAINTQASNLANQNYQQWLANLSGVGSQGLQAASGISGNNQSAGGIEFNAGSQGAQLSQGLGSALGNLGVGEGTGLAGIQSNLGNSLAGLQQGLGESQAGNILSAATGVANLGVTGGQAADSADNTNSGILSKLIGGVTGLPFGGASTVAPSTGGFTVAPGSNGAFSVTPSGASASGGGLLSGALSQAGNQIRGYL